MTFGLCRKTRHPSLTGGSSQKSTAGKIQTMFSAIDHPGTPRLRQSFKCNAIAAEVRSTPPLAMAIFCRFLPSADA